MRRITVGDWSLFPESNQIERNGLVRRLERRSVDVLVELCKQPGVVYSKESLIDAVWGGKVVSDHSVSIVISDLRRALGDSTKAPTYIETVPKRGYRLIANVAEEAESNHDVRAKATLAQKEKTPFPPSQLRPGTTVAAALGLALVSTILWLVVDAGGESEQRDLGPIIVADVCTDSTSAEISSIAYGFAELLTVSLANMSQTSVVRIRNKSLDEARETIEQLSKVRRGSLPVWISSAVINVNDEAILTIEVIRSDTKELVWGSQVRIDGDSLESAVRSLAAEIESRIRESSTS